MRTNNLRKLVQAKLKTVCDNAYYENADEDKMYPHCVFSFQFIDTSDTGFARSDATLTIDVWDKSKSAIAIEDLCDSVEDLFNGVNQPQDSILPTFYLISRTAVTDDVKEIRHRVIRVLVQNYENEV